MKPFHQFTGHDLYMFRLSLGKIWTLKKFGKEIAGYSPGHICTVEGKKDQIIPPKLITFLTLRFPDIKIES